MRHIAKSALCGLYKYSGAMFAHERLSHWQGRRRSTSVLLFHRVTDAIPPDGITVGVAWFRRLCKMLHRSFNVVPLAEMLRLHQTQETPPPRTVSITFDDCYFDNLHAAQVLAEYRLPACFFMPTQYVETDHVFEWDRYLPRMPNLTWNDVHAIAKMGHEIGSHTVSHPDMGVIGPEQTRRELIESKATLESKLGRPVRFFAIPFGQPGNFRPDYLPLVHEAGYDACFSAFGGVIEPSLLGQVLPREPVPQFRSLLNFELHLTGCLDWFYRLKRKSAASRRSMPLDGPRSPAAAPATCLPQ